MTEAGYAVEGGIATPAEAAQMREAADALDGAGGTHLGILPVLLVILGMLGLLDLAFGIIGTASWMVLIVGAAILLVPAAIIHRRGAAGPEQARLAAAALRREAAAGRVRRHVLHRTTRHWFVEHEHGVMHLCPAGPGRTLFLDLSSASGDPRHDAWFAKGRIHRAAWRWASAGDNAMLLGFVAEGDKVVPNRLAAALGHEDPVMAAAIFGMLGSPGDGDVIPLDFAKIDADVRARIAVAKDG